MKMRKTEKYDSLTKRKYNTSFYLTKYFKILQKNSFLENSKLKGKTRITSDKKGLTSNVKFSNL